MKKINSPHRLGLLFAGFLMLMLLVQPASAASKMPSFVLSDVVTGDTVDSKLFSGKNASDHLLCYLVSALYAGDPGFDPVAG